MENNKQIAQSAAQEMLQALKKIVEMNYQNAEDQYGDRNKAKTWSCVTVAEAAIKTATASNQIDIAAQPLENEQLEARAGKTPIEMLIDKLEQIKLKSIRPESKRTGEYRIGLNAAIVEAVELLPTEASYIKATKGDEWIDVKDRLPEKGQSVLAIQNPKTTATKEPLFAIYTGSDFTPPQPTIFADYQVGQSKWVDIIKWQPLPPTPNNNKI